MKIFSYDGSFSRIMSRVFDLVLLHFLWVLTSIPIITIGASTTALFSIALKMEKNEESYIIKSYWKAFRENWKKSTILWIAMAGMFLWNIFILKICLESDQAFLKILALLQMSFLIILFLASMYVFPIQAVFENTMKNIWKNALICSLRYLPYTLGMAAVVILPILVTGYVQSLFAVMIAFWMSCGSSLIAYGESIFLNKVFRKVS